MREAAITKEFAQLLLARYKIYFVFVASLSFATAVVNTSFGAMLKWLTDSLQRGAFEIVAGFILVFAAQRFMLPLAGAANTLVSNMLANKIETDIRSAWYLHVTRLDFAHSKAKNSGEAQKKIQEAVFSVRAVMNNSLRSLLSIGLEVVAITGFAAWFIGPVAALLLMGFAAVYAVFVILATRRRLPIMQEIARSDANCTAFMHDSFINSGSISTEARMARSGEHMQLLATLEHKKNLNARQLFWDSGISAVICLSASLVLLFQYYSPAASAGAVVMLATSLAQMIIQINTLGLNYRSIVNMKIDLMRISDALIVTAQALPSQPKDFLNGRTDIFHFNRFQLGGSHEALPVSGDLVIEACTLNVLRGSSGIGKSSIVRALRGETRVPAGEIAINGIDCSSLPTELRLSQIGHVSQDTVIFNEAISKNLHYGRSSASEQEITQVLRKVGMTRFAERRDYVVGEKGGLLSGGERQRLVIARGLLQDCRILILDEPFAGLDPISAKALAATIDELAETLSILVVMHEEPERIFGNERPLNKFLMSEHDGLVHLKREEKVNC